MEFAVAKSSFAESVKDILATKKELKALKKDFFEENTKEIAKEKLMHLKKAKEESDEEYDDSQITIMEDILGLEDDIQDMTRIKSSLKSKLDNFDFNF